MSFERTGPSIPAEPGPPGSTTDVTSAETIPPAMRLQILSTEHWSLLATRSLVWNEVFGRAGMFLSALSGAIVALALVGQGTGFGASFTQFAIVILPVVLFLGIATFIRLGASLYHDAQCVIGMNRIRAAYLELAPDLARYFVMSGHDDARGAAITQAVQPGGGAMPLAHLIAATPAVVIILNAVLAGIITALAALRAGGDASAIFGVGVLGFLVAMALQSLYARRNIAKALSLM